MCYTSKSCTCISIISNECFNLQIFNLEVSSASCFKEMIQCFQYFTHCFLVNSLKPHDAFYNKVHITFGVKMISREINVSSCWDVFIYVRINVFCEQLRDSTLRVSVDISFFEKQPFNGLFQLKLMVYYII